MYKYQGSVTNDETFIETFEITTDGVDISGWDIEFVVDGKVATVEKDAERRSFTATLPRATMEGFCPGSYNVGCRYTEDGVTTQILIGTLAVVEGNF